MVQESPICAKYTKVEMHQPCVFGEMEKKGGNVYFDVFLVYFLILEMTVKPFLFRHLFALLQEYLPYSAKLGPIIARQNWYRDLCTCGPLVPGQVPGISISEFCPLAHVPPAHYILASPAQAGAQRRRASLCALAQCSDAV